MSEASLKSILQKAATDPEFVKEVKKDALAALATFDLSTAELFALACGDGNALQRLAGLSGGLPSTEISAFHHAALPAVDEQARRRLLAMEVADVSGGTKTDQVTSQTVTVCCWGVEKMMQA